jgi:hypothetical protein
MQSQRSLKLNYLFPYIDEVTGVWKCKPRSLSGMPSAGILCRAAPVRINVSEEHIASIIRVKGKAS